MNARTAFHTAASSQPRRLTRGYKRQLRQDAEAAIEALIGLLDQIDGDSDLEPYLSQTSGGGAGENQEREWIFPAEEHENSDDEPWLSSPEPTVSAVSYPWSRNEVIWRDFDPLDQTRWANNTCDLEDQCEDEGGQCDDEGHDSDTEPAEVADNGYCGTSPFVIDQSDTAEWLFGRVR